MPISAKRAIELTQTIYAMDFILPESKQIEMINLNLSEEEKLIWNVIR